MQIIYHQEIKTLKFELKSVDSCCNNKILYLTLERPLNYDECGNFNQLGLFLNQKYAKSGALYLESCDLIISGTFSAKIYQITLISIRSNETLNRFLNVIKLIT